MFSSDQIKELLRLIDYHHVLFGAEFLGPEPLSTDDIDLLESYGVDIDNIPQTSYIETAYKFGILSQAIGMKEAKNLNYNDFKKWIRKGGYIPLSDEEKQTVKFLKKRSFSHLKNLGKIIGSNTEQILLSEENKRKGLVEKIIRKELSEGLVNRDSFQDILLALGHKTGDWQRDWGRIVETELHTVQEEGRADDIQRNSGQDDPLVFKHVYPGACRWCIKLYLTNGLGSKPIVFRLSQLRANGDNIGKKPDQWKATLGCIHPWDRCTIDYVPDGYEWSDESKMFVPSKKQIYVSKRKRSKVELIIGNKTYYV